MVKKLVLLAYFVVFTLLACSSDDHLNPVQVDETVVITDLDSDIMLDFIPQHLKDEKSVVYKNQEGEFWTLATIVHHPIISQDSSFDVRYTTSEFQVVLYDSTQIDFELGMYSHARWRDDQKVYAINSLLNLFHRNGGVLSTVQFDAKTGDHYSEFDTFHERLTLLDKSFEKVYEAKAAPQDGVAPTAYSQLFTSKEVGVVGFRDKANVLWVFDGISN